MISRPWPYTDRLTAAMADSSLLDDVDPGVLRREPRSGGLHVSEVLKTLYPPPASEINEWQLSVYGLMGLAFEDRAELALHKLGADPTWPYYSYRSEEVEWYGVKGSPDIILVPKPKFAATHTTRELSLKVKWRSSRGIPLETAHNAFPRRWAYEIAQCQVYSVPLGTTGSILLVYFVCGDWKPPTPHVLAWELDFDPEEVAETMDAFTTVATEILLRDPGSQPETVKRESFLARKGK